MEATHALPLEILLQKLMQNGVRLWMEDEQLRYRAPKGGNIQQLLAALRNHSAELRKLLRVQSVRSQAQEPRLHAQTSSDSVPLATMQRGMVEGYSRAAEPHALHPRASTVFESELNIADLRTACRELMARHSVLRTRFRSSSTERYVAVAETDVDCDIRHLDISGLADDTAAKALLTNATVARFDLEREGLIRIVVVTLTATTHIVLIVAHHAILDGIALKQFLRELEAVYRAIAQRGTLPAATHRLQFSDFALYQQQWLKSPSAQAARQYWSEKLRGVSAPFDLPSPRPASGLAHHHDRPIGHGVRGDVVVALRAIARAEGTTFRMAALAAFVMVLARLRESKEVFTWVCHPGRAHPELYHTLGCFFDLWMLRVEVPEHATFVEVLRRVRDAYVEATPFMELPFLEIARSVRNSTTNIMFSHLTNDEDASADGRVESSSGSAATRARALIDDLPEVVHLSSASRQALSFASFEGTTGYSWRIQHAPEIVDCGTMERASLNLAAVLERAAVSPQLTLSDLAPRR